MGSPTAELARKQMNDEANKLSKELTQHNPAKVQKLIDANIAYQAKMAIAGDIVHEWAAVCAALEALRPKPARVWALSTQIRPISL